MRRLIRTIIGSTLLGGVMAVGCTGNEPRPLDPEAFRLPRGVVEESPLGPVDRPPARNYDMVNVNLMLEEEPSPDDPEGISDVEGSIHPPTPAPTPSPPDEGRAIPAGQPGGPRGSDPEEDSTRQGSTNGVTRLSYGTTGQFLTLGGVVAEVNGRPIYANEVIRRLQTLLAAEARKYDREAFQIVARELIRQMVFDMISEELLFAAAMRSLEQRDRVLAERAATQFRQELITKAQGSVELARRRAREQGQDLEEIVREYHREFVVDLFKARKVHPRIQVTVDQMRRYYDEHVETEFTEHSQVRFRVIKVDPRSAGSRSAARDRVEDLHRVAVSGAMDFAKLAGMHNDDTYAKQNNGDVGWVWRGNYIEPEVERVVWQTPVGQVTDIIDAGGAFYIAKVEEVKEGNVRPFDEREPPEGKAMTVQEEIYEALAMPQQTALLSAIQDDWAREAVVRDDEEMLQPAVDLAMQNYARWSDSARALADVPSGGGN